MDDHQKYQRCDRYRQRDAKTQNYDDRIGEEISDYGEQPNEEGDDQHCFGQRQMHAGQRQRDEQIQCGQEGVDGRDAGLGEHDASERFAHADHALSHGPCERSEGLMRLHVMQWRQHPDSQAKKNVCQRAPRLRPNLLQLPGV